MSASAPISRETLAQVQALLGHWQHAQKSLGAGRGAATWSPMDWIESHAVELVAAAPRAHELDALVKRAFGSAGFDAVRLHAIEACTAFLNAATTVELEMRSPSAIYRPALSRDGNQWCALYGANLQDGVAGFGSSPAEAMADFNRAWHRRLPASTPEDIRAAGGA